MNEEKPIEGQLIEDAFSLGSVELFRSEVTPTADPEELSVTIEFQVDPRALEVCAFGVLYLLGALSFKDARPRGISETSFKAGDGFRSDDMLRHVRFERGNLTMRLDYLRGRCLKTDVVIAPDGRVEVSTRCRGEAAVRWVDRLRGKRFLHPVEP